MEVAGWNLQAWEFIEACQLKVVDGVGWIAWCVTLLVFITSTLAWYGGKGATQVRTVKPHARTVSTMSMWTYKRKLTVPKRDDGAWVGRRGVGTKAFPKAK